MTLSSILDLWSKWNLRGSVVLSFSLQVFLTLFAFVRKKTANHHMYFLLWLAYLAADLVAIFAIGLISHGQCNLSAHVAKVDKAVQAFWASFLFLHLGGPETLTAFSLEDSLLWNRHLLIYIFQFGATISLFVQIFLSNKSLLIPTMMVFLAGNIKFVERTRALYLSSLPKLRQSMMTPMYIPPPSEVHNPAPNLNALGYKYSNEEDAKLAESNVVKHAYLWFRIFKVFIVDLIYTRDQRADSRRYFSSVSAMDALRVISTEFHFFYEMLHTKVLAIHSKWSYFFRSIAFTLVTVAFVLFIHSNKHGLSGLDVKITYILLSGGIALDAIALLMLLFSDWTIAKIMLYEFRSGPQSSFLSSLLSSFLSWLSSSFLSRLLSAMIDMKKPRVAKYKAIANPDLTYDVLNTLFIFRRWSETISACNLFSEYLKESPRKMYKCGQGFRLSNILIFPFHTIGKAISYFHQAGKTIVQSCRTGIRWMIANTEPDQAGRTTDERERRERVVTYFTDKQWMIENTENVSKHPFICKLWIFIFEEVRRKSVGQEDLENAKRICEARGDWFVEIHDGQFLEDYLTKISYDTSIIVWHIATEICYNMEETVEDRNMVDRREFSKILSDYVLYLLLNQPKVMSAVANVAQITSYEFGLRLSLLPWSNDVRNVEQLCKQMIRDQSLMSEPSPLRTGICLADDMARLGERKWEVMSRVWVEMLSYGAIHIKGETHMQVLSQGGELLAFVWLLMLHFGLFHKDQWGISYEPGLTWYIPLQPPLNREV